MSGKYSYKLDNKINNYTIYCGDDDLEPDEVVGLLNGAESKNVQPSYYGMNGASPLDCFRQGLISHDELVGFCKGNIVKYVVRAGLKDGESAFKDYSKANDYLGVLLELSKE